MPALVPRLRADDFDFPARPRVIAIATARQPADLADATRLFEAFHRDTAERYADQPHLLRLTFVPAAWRTELALLPGHYAAPTGALLLARVDGRALGCVALRACHADAQTAELKRLFVEPSARRSGLARALLARAIAEARTRRYHRIAVELGSRQRAAHALLEAMGFERAAHLRQLPVALERDLVSYRLAL